MQSCDETFCRPGLFVSTLLATSFCHSALMDSLEKENSRLI